MTVGSKINILQLLKCKMRIILCDCRTLIGTFAAYDQHMNVVLIDCVEYKKYKAKKQPAVEGKKTLGVVIIRGENITSIIVDEQPPGSSSRYESSSRSYRR
ncbi:small nuclear ribonucleoprotein-associated protein B' [Trichonephila clavata]|uniref:Sm protein B n=1 Tax=Trichonephila clavata TaxID=2740835 RepID=A0A8X6LM74_TRICU|nr:small nuclear ribonucleoprotein-associated protein B' [Trichonephila clavata]